MRLFTATLAANTEILPGVHLQEMHDPQLARIVQPGQYCMLRCCDSLASDPLLRRAFFVHESEPESGVFRLLVYKRGRGSAWLTRQPAGTQLDILGPLGHGWTLGPATRNLLLIGEEPVLAALISLVRGALENEIVVTLLSFTSNGVENFPAALLPPEVEYQVLSTAVEPAVLSSQMNTYIDWADAVCCSVSRETLQLLTQIGTRWREKHFAQLGLWQPLPCANGACLSCQIETRHGPRLVCRDGPVFPFNELAES